MISREDFSELARDFTAKQRDKMVEEKAETEKAEVTEKAAAPRVHGFVWPKGMPDCVMCGRNPNDGVHVTPSRHRPQMLPIIAADKSAANMPMRSHPYMMNVPALTSQVACASCGSSLENGIHAVGLPSGAVPSSSNSGLYGGGWGMPTAATLASEVHPPSTQQAFVAEVGSRLVFAAPATTGFDSEALPREVALAFQLASEANPNNLWLTGRYVEADRPNRNAAFWSTEDLELGQPSVTHGPINWLHDEKHIIGAIAASEMVKVDRQAAATTGVGNHIVVLGGLWPYIYPQESRIIARASDDQRLWFSMECVSREVACLTCDKSLAYADYQDQMQRCDHMKAGLPRRFVDPVFAGAGIIVPPVRPGWVNADAKVLMPQAAELVERQAASFVGMSTSESELLVAQILASLEQ